MSVLSEEIEELKDKLHEERFLWVVVVTIFFDVVTLRDAATWTAPIVIGVLELIGLIVLAKRCRVDPVMPLLDRLSGWAATR